MPIYHPGKKFRHSRILSRKKGGRDVVAILSLTAMVDMFTVLVVFLLQNYNTTGEVIYIPEEVDLPRAELVKELTPSHVVTVSDREVLIGKDVVEKTYNVRRQNDWLIDRLYRNLRKSIRDKEREAKIELRSKLREVVDKPNFKRIEKDPSIWRKVTVQADKGIDFLTIKKILYTVTEAGAGEINFAVLQRKSDE